MPNQTVRQILTINTGSSSLKVALYEAGREETRILSGEVERIGVPGGRFRLTDARGATLIDQGGDLPDHGAALEAVLAGLRRYRPDLSLDAVGHRVVHGGAHYSAPQRVTPELIAALQELVPIAPDHLPQAIQAIQTVVRVHPDLPQVACFDTAFHRRMPRTAQLYPLPRRLADEGVVRYGFHGLSYESILRELRALAPREAEGRVVIAHLGNGASMAAVRGGIGIDTTMGFTPAGGLMMGTRPGDLDPGVLLYLLVERGMTPAAVNDLVNREAGLLGVSGVSADMRDLLEREAAGRASRRGNHPVLLSSQEVSGCPGRRPGRPGHPGLHRRDRGTRRLRPAANLRGFGLPRHPDRSAPQRGARPRHFAGGRPGHRARAADR